MPVPADFLTRIVKDERTLQFTLPNGRPVVGKIEQLERGTAGVTTVVGVLQHPEPGSFFFARAADRLSGSLHFTESPTQWTIEPAATPGSFCMVESPAADAFRPHKMVLPTQPQPHANSPAMVREAAEAALRKSLKIEQLAPGKLRLGVVEIQQDSRSIRIPATLNQRSGVIEYALVAYTGKLHEALFATTAAPQHVHLALLLLGIKPARCVENPDHDLSVPAHAAVRVTVEWEVSGIRQSHPLAELVTTRAEGAVGQPLSDRLWQCNGSKFNDAGFGATLEGSIIALIADDMALLNNSGPDRSDDEGHFANAAMLPPKDTPVTLLIALPLPASSEKPEPANP